MGKTLITGGAGFLGSALARRLYAEGREVAVFDNLSRGHFHRLPAGISCISGDITDREAVVHAAEGCSAIYHLAYVQGTQTFYEEPATVVRVALRGILNVIEASIGKELLLVSSSEAYQIPPEGMTPTDETVPLSVPDVTNPRYSYGGGKIACEIAAMAYSSRMKRLVIVRPHNIYGPDMGQEHVIPEFCIRMKDLQQRFHTAPFEGIAPEGEAFKIQGTGQETRSFCYIDDAARGLALLLDQGGHREVYHLGTEEEVTIGALAAMVGAEFGFEELTIQPGKLPEGSPPRRLPDIRKMRALGYEPRIRLATGLEVTCDWYRLNV